MDEAKELLQRVLEEFRESIAHHRAEGASEARINQILSASVRLAVQQVHDPELCVWLCEEFAIAAELVERPTLH